MNKRILLAVKVAVAVGLLAYLLSRIDLHALLDRYAQANVALLALAYALAVGQFALSSLKWKVILAADQARVAFGFLMRTYMIGSFMGLFLPTGFGGDLYRVYALREDERGVARNASSVLFDRLTGLFALVSIAFLAAVFMPNAPLNRLLLLLYPLGLVGFWAMTSAPVIARLERTPHRLARPPVTVLSAFRTYRTDKWRLFQTLLIAFLFQANIVFINKLYCMALGIDMPLRSLFMIIPLIYLTEVLPVSINGLGVRESAYVVFFALMGQTAEAGLAVSLIEVVIRYASGLLGGVLLLLSVFKSRTYGKPVGTTEIR